MESFDHLCQQNGTTRQTIDPMQRPRVAAIDPVHGTRCGTIDREAVPVNWTHQPDQDTWMVWLQIVRTSTYLCPRF